MGAIHTRMLPSATLASILGPAILLNLRSLQETKVTQLFYNRYIITWMLDQIFVYSDKITIPTIQPLITSLNPTG